MRNYIKFYAAVGLLIFGTARGRAIEIPLEGFGKSTLIAFVDMHKIFESFPETEKARVELNRMIEEKKAEISEKKEEIAKLKGEVEFLKKRMEAVQPSTAAKTEPAEVPPAPPQEVPVTPPSDTQTAPPPPAEPVTSLALPEGSPLGFIFSPPLESTQTAPVETSTQTAPVLTVSTAAPQILPGIPSPGPQLEEKEAALSQKEADLETLIGVAEQELRTLEEGRTMTLMARIYRGLEEVAARGGFSLIVDKASILYGEPGADITQDIIFRISGRPRIQ